MFSYRAILKQAWIITWKHKYLWFFGLFASLAIASGGVEHQFIATSFNQNLINGSFYFLNYFLAFGLLMQNLWSGIVELFSYDLLTIVNTLTVALTALILIATFIWLTFTSQAALVIGIKKIVSAKKKDAVLSIREGMTKGHKHFWSVLSLNLLAKVLICASLFIIGLPLLFMLVSKSYIAIILYTLFFVVFVPIAVSITLIIKYAICYRVLDDESFVLSIEKAYKLFKKNWLISIELAIILFIISFLAGFLLLALGYIFIVPLFLVGAMLKATWLMSLMIALGFIILVVFGSVLTTFQVSTWTNLFLLLKDNQGAAKLERIFKRKK